MDGFWESENAGMTACGTLAAWIGGQCIPHAILIEGPDENTNSALALHIAKAAMCAGDTDAEKPCGSCRDCVKLEKGVHPDFLTYGGDGRARSFHIDAVREIRSKAFIRPNEAETKVFVLRGAHEMTVQAQNALLKILEEPPKSVIFILTCENKSSLLETVLSRVTAISAGDRIENNSRPHTAESDDSSAGEAAKSGAKVMRLLMDSEELDALAELSRYERDRAGFIGVLSHMRRELENILLPGRGMHNPHSIDDNAHYADKSITGNALLRLMRVIDIIDDVSRAASGNGSLVLLSGVLCGRIRRELAG